MIPRRACLALLFCILVLSPIHAQAGVPAWWPCQPRGTGCPTYDHRVPVIDQVRAGAAWREHRNLALRRWNRCDVLHLFVSHHTPFSPNTITLFVDRDGMSPRAPYGGWAGDHGIAAFAEHWTMLTDVVTHEIGHALGLGHNRLNDSVMGNSSRVGDVDCRAIESYY